MSMRSLTMILLLTTAASSWAGVKTFVGQGVPTTSWDQALNWEPAGQPTANDTVYIAFAPYVTISGPSCTAHTVVIQNGGRLVVRESDIDNRLTVERDFIVEQGGAFTAEGAPGVNGPLVYIGGDIHNAGTWNLAGVGTATKGVIFNRLATQHIYGPNPLTFQNLANTPNDTLVVSVAHVGVMGYTTPLDWFNATMTDGGTLNIGGPPLPITLARFDAVVVAEEGLVRLSWRTLSEVDNYGFTAERSPADADAYEALGFIPSSGTGIQVRDYSFDDASVTAGRWSYRLRQKDLTGAESLSEAVTVVVPLLTSVGADAMPSVMVLAQNYPNPFNPETVIRFSVPNSGSATLTVYDVAGSRVAILFDGLAHSGQEYTVRFAAGDLPSGAYYYRLNAGTSTQSRRMLLVR